MIDARPSAGALRSALLAGLLILAGAVAPLAGCRGDRSDEPPRQFFPSLDDQPKYKPQTSSDLFADGRSQRRPPDGVVAFSRFVPRDVADEQARGDAPAEAVNDPVEPLVFGGDAPQRDRAREWVRRMRQDLLRESGPVYTGKTSEGAYVQRMPVGEILGAGPGESVGEAAIERFIETGRDRYMIYCYPCHGGLGDGMGPVGTKWSYPLPSFHAEQYQRGGEKGEDGLIFWTIRNGVPNTPGQQPALKMPSYAEKIPEREAWAIVAYIRALQRAQRGSLEDVPEAKRQDLLRQLPAGAEGEDSQASVGAADAASGD